ncbi:hypothetical protein [Streptomyces sp. ME19-01-6]|uniref:hypothetical protein n=1 Tax=Streptomyces sp. ME19-01-6 TaxID=3028686 RepID=UPI0029B53B5E|nr:hypothetical protein [Streptomyces sp. ME19-01-6]MDX3230545.1 hypothetical protein [Streptomyces sp. ME19-01-6]
MDDRLADIKDRSASTLPARKSDEQWLIQQLEQARRIAVELEQSEARLRDLLETLTKAWGREQDHELATAERQNQGENANGAYERGASLERCGDDIRHLLEHGDMPDWYDADDQEEAA